MRKTLLLTITVPRVDALSESFIERKGHLKSIPATEPRDTRTMRLISPQVFAPLSPYPPSLPTMSAARMSFEYARYSSPLVSVAR